MLFTDLSTGLLVADVERALGAAIAIGFFYLCSTAPLYVIFGFAGRRKSNERYSSHPFTASSVH
jgi:hypothetical protein